jgi:DNA-binding CsgD family transcriptional regulator
VGDADDANKVLVEPLAWREQDILHLLAERRTNREIAQSLGLELMTVKWYNKQIFSKLGVGSRYQAVAKAQEYGLLDEPRGAPVAEGSPPKGSLPGQVTSFVGRGREIGDVKRLLQVAHLLTLTGPAGTGKTRLALQVAAELADVDAFEDGVFFVDLAVVNQSEGVGEAIAEALNIVTSAREPISERLATYLGTKKLLLLLQFRLFWRGPARVRRYSLQWWQPEATLCQESHLHGRVENREPTDRSGRCRGKLIFAKPWQNVKVSEIECKQLDHLRRELKLQEVPLTKSEPVKAAA